VCYITLEMSDIGFGVDRLPILRKGQRTKGKSKRSDIKKMSFWNNGSSIIQLYHDKVIQEFWNQFPILFTLQHLKCDEFYHFIFFISISFTTRMKLIMAFAIASEPINNLLFFFFKLLIRFPLHTK